MFALPKYGSLRGSTSASLKIWEILPNHTKFSKSLKHFNSVQFSIENYLIAGQNYDLEGIHQCILWSNQEIKIDGRSVFYKHFFDNNHIRSWSTLWDDKYWVFQCRQRHKIEELQLLRMDRSKAIRSTVTASSYAQLREYPWSRKS